MSKDTFQVEQIDHVELIVPDQYEAAKWYEAVFGLTIIKSFEDWAANGPLMLSSDGGSTKLALFQGEPPGFQPLVGFKRVAFRVNGTDFFTFLDRLKTHAVFSHEGDQINTLDIVDHDKSYSLYFCDPYGNRYEITTYDYDYVSGCL